jgi:hypothetical protein
MFAVIAPSAIAHAAMAIPIAANEMALATWLILKGFNQPSTIETGVAKTAHAR